MANKCVEDAIKKRGLKLEDLNDVLDTGNDASLNQLLEGFADRSKKIAQAYRTAPASQKAEFLMKAKQQMLDELQEHVRVTAKKNLLNAVAKESMVKELDVAKSDNKMAVLHDFVKRAETQSTVRAQEFYNAIMTDLKANAEVLHHAKKGDKDLEVLSIINDMERGVSSRSNDKIAREIAAIYHKYNESMRAEKLKMGEPVGKIEDYGAYQGTNQFKVRRTSKDVFVNDLMEWLDLDKTDGMVGSDFFGNPKAREIAEEEIGQLYTSFESGIHRTQGHGRSRKMIFKNPESRIAYMKKYGDGRLLDSMMHSIETTGMMVGKAEVLGPSGSYNVRSLQELAEKKTRGIDDNKTLKDVAKERRRMDAALDEMDGKMKPESLLLNGIGRTLRVHAMVTKLGSSVFSMTTDPVTMAQAAKANGRGWYKGIQTAVDSLLNTNVPKELKQKVAANLAFRDDVLRHSMSGATFDPELRRNGGFLSKVTEVMMTLNLMGPITNAFRRAQLVGDAHWLGQNADLAWDALPDRLRASLEYDGITGLDWEVIRKATNTMSEGEDSITFLDPKALRDLDDDAFAPYAAARGWADNAASRTRARRDLEAKLNHYYNESLNSAVIEASGETRRAMTGGTRPGTLPGELTRSVLQFKSHPISIIRQRMARDKAIDTALGESYYLKTLPQYLFAMTAAGIAASYMKDIAKGRVMEPTPENMPRIFFRGFAQGGAVGILGDIINPDMRDGYGRGLANVMAGPVIGGNLADISSMIGSAMSVAQGDIKPDALYGEAFRAAKGNIPLGNHFILKPMLDMAFMEEMQENISPGAHRRFQNKYEKLGYHFIW